MGAGIGIGRWAMFAAALAVLAIQPAATAAATINVDHTADESSPNNGCSLREAVTSANTDSNAHEPDCEAGEGSTGLANQVTDVVSIPAGTYVLNADSPAGTDENANASGDLDVFNTDASVPTSNRGANVRFVGAGDDGAGSTVIDANDGGRAIDVKDDGTASAIQLTIEDLKIVDGKVTDANSTADLDDDGGAILMRDLSGKVRVTRSTIESSEAARWGGAISFSSTMSVSEPFTVTDSELRSNTAGGRGGAVYSKNFGSGGAARIIRSTLANNESMQSGGAIYLAAEAGETSGLLVTNSTLSGNTAATGGGAIGIGTVASVTQIAFSTISGNSTPLAGGGGGIQTTRNDQQVNLWGTILAGNTANSAAVNCEEIDDAGADADGNFNAVITSYNLESANTCDLITATPNFDLVNANAGLGTLADNSGETRTHALLAGSQALDGVPTSACNPMVPLFGQPVNGLDQRSIARPVGTNCDVGALEDTLPTIDPDAATVSEDSAATAIDVIANDDLERESVSVASVSDPPNGTAAIAAGGSGLSYQPDPDYCGADSFNYALNSGGTATVSVTVTCVDDAPTAVDDTAITSENAAPITIGVLVNDTDVDGGDNGVTSVSDPAHGTAAIGGDDSAVTYQPDAGYCNDPSTTGLDTFTYTLNGGSTATVTVTVTCADEPPPSAKCGGKKATIVGSGDDEVIKGTAGADVIAAGGGDDKVRGLGAGDLICGGGGDDELDGNGGKDVLNGGAGKDELDGGPGRDDLNGGPGKDVEKQ